MKTIEEKLKLCEKSYYGFIRDNAARNGDNVYLADEDRSLTRREAKAMIETLAYRLADAGVKKGDLVAVRATRCLDIAIILPALTLTGAVAVMTDAHCGVREYVESSGVDMRPARYVTNEHAGGGIDAKGDWLLINDDSAAPLDFTVPVGHSSARAEAMDTAVNVTDPCLIIFTSGSTGRSKAVTLCQRNYITNSVDGGDMFEECEKDTSALVLPLHHIFGLALIVCATVNDHGVFFPKKADPEYVAEILAERVITVLYGVPTYLLSLAETVARQRRKPSLRFALIAGGPSTTAQMEFIERSLGCRLVPVYGMSEFVGITSLPYAAPSALRCAGVGKFYPLNEGFILGDDERPVSPGEEGEICVSGYDLMLGYYNDEEATREAIDERGRLHTGDLGYMDEKGIVHISGRKKDIIIRGGENISAGKIEQALLSLPEVSQAVVVGAKDAHYGEVPCAMVICHRHVILTEKELKERLGGKLFKHEIPVGIIVTDAFPLTSTGKPDKQKIKELFTQWKA